MFGINHRVEVEWNEQHGIFDAFVLPCVGRQCYLNVDFDDGIFEFNVSWSSGGYYDMRQRIEAWIKEDCDQFVFQGKCYGSIEELSLALWMFELQMAANDERAVDDVLECVGPFYNEIQKELFAWVM